MIENWIGYSINQHYKLIDKRGRGNFATVYIGRDLRDNHVCAVKILDLERLHPETRDLIIARFQREAFILQQLLDPHIVNTLDFGKDKESDTYFIVMDYVDGHDLKQHIAMSGQMDLLRALNYTRQVAEGLDTTYKRGVVHRDIKPQNLLVNRQDIVKISDFGLGRCDTPTLTSSGDFLGTPNYISPEQINNAHRVDTRSDLYSLTAVLFEMLTGRPPFTANSIMEVVIKHLREPVPSAHQLRNDLSQYPDIDAFIQKGMAKAPAERYQTPREFLLALERIQQQISTRPLPRQAYLVLLPDERPIPLVDETITVGRPAPNRPKPDICLTDERVSRSHARLYKRQGTYAIEALSSKNRTCLNEQILPLGEEHILKHNDRLQFGPVEGRFELR